MNIQEKLIAEKAEQMLTRALQNETKSFKEHYYGNKENSLKNAEAKARTKEFVSKDGNFQKVYFNKLILSMGRHGFVQHYGADIVRAGRKRTRKTPRTIDYYYQPHKYFLKPTNFITRAIERSGVINYVAENIAKERAEELQFYIGRFIP